MRCHVLAAAFGAFAPALATLSFVNPPSAAGSTGTTGLSETIAFVEFSLLNIVWETGTEGLTSSVTLWQVNATTGDPMGDLAYITQGNAWNTTSFPFNVNPLGFDLTVSNLFMMSIYESGSTSPDDWTVFFKFTSGATPTPSTNSKSTISSTNPTPSADIASTSPTSTSAFTTVSSSNTSDSVMETGAKIGIGVGIPIAVFIGIAAGWLIFRKHKNGGDSPDPALLEEDKTHLSNRYTNHSALQNKVYELSGRDRALDVPVEM